MTKSPFRVYVRFFLTWLGLIFGAVPSAGQSPYQGFFYVDANPYALIVGYNGPPNVVIPQVVHPGTLQQRTVFQLVTGLFRDNTTITSLSIPPTVQIIGAELCMGCSGLQTVVLPANLTAIPNGMFWNCPSLTGITLPPNLVTIGNNAFQNCGSLPSITFPNTLTSIGTQAFFLCAKFTAITIPPGVKTISDRAFWACRDLASLTLHPAVTSIGELAFSGCDLTSITFPASLTSVGGRAFSGNAFTTVQIPATLTSIAPAAFSENDCTFDVSPSNPNYRSFDGKLFSRDLSVLKQVRTSLAGRYIVPGTVTTIEDYAFAGCAQLTRIGLPPGLKTIGERAFQGCGMEYVTIPASVTSMGGSAFGNCPSLFSATFEGDAPLAPSPPVFDFPRPDLVIYFYPGARNATPDNFNGTATATIPRLVVSSYTKTGSVSILNVSGGLRFWSYELQFSPHPESAVWTTVSSIGPLAGNNSFQLSHSLSTGARGFYRVAGYAP